MASPTRRRSFSQASYGEFSNPMGVEQDPTRSTVDHVPYEDCHNKSWLVVWNMYDFSIQLGMENHPN